MTPYRPQPADPLDLAVLYLTLAVTNCPDQVRRAMIALLGAQITSRHLQTIEDLLSEEL